MGQNVRAEVATREDAIAGSAAAPMALEEYGALLNQLLEAERAGAKLITAYIEGLPPGSATWKGIRAVQGEDALNCAALIRLLVDAELHPSLSVGDVYAKGIAIEGWRQRLEFLNRGRDRAAKTIAAALPRVPEGGRATLARMRNSHLANIEKCRALM
jgi:nitronate monooxygenase